MGLKGGETGVKAQFKTKFKQAFRVFDDLQDARDNVFEGFTDGGSPRSRTVVLVDGNVAMMGVSEACRSMAEFTEVVFNGVRDAFRAAQLVVVVFDEPKAMPNAKREEQAARDAARRARAVTASDDMLTTPLVEGFTAEELDALDDVHVLKADRKCRSRLYDEVTKRVLERMGAMIENWEHKGHGRCELIIDGADPRGCARAVDAPRAPQMFGTCAATAAKLARNVPIGEGDIKLIALENRIRALKAEAADDEPFAKVSLVITSTVDTDSFMTMVLDVAKRRVAPYAAPMHSLFCMREAVSKRQREDDPSARATYLCVDVALLEGHLQSHVWAQAAVEPTPTQMLHAMLAVSASAAMCGCDFTLTGLKGSRFDHFLESLPDFVASEPEALESLGAALAPEAEEAQSACDGIYRVCVTASKHMEKKPRYQKQSKTVLGVSDVLLRRACWTAGYWGQVERASDESAGFAPAWSA